MTYVHRQMMTYFDRKLAQTDLVVYTGLYHLSIPEVLECRKPNHHTFHSSFPLPISDALSFVIFHYETLLFFDELIHSLDFLFHYKFSQREVKYLVERNMFTITLL